MSYRKTRTQQDDMSMWLTYSTYQYPAGEKKFYLPHSNNIHQLYNWLWAGQSGDRIPVGARFSAPVQTGAGDHPAFCTLGTGSFPGVKSGPGVTLTPYPLLVPWSRKSIAIPLLTLWAIRPVQSLSACTMVHFTYTTMLQTKVTDSDEASVLHPVHFYKIFMGYGLIK